MLVYCQNKICNDIHVPEKEMYKRRFEFLIIYLKLFLPRRNIIIIQYFLKRDKRQLRLILYKFIKLVLNNWGTYFNNKQMTINGNRRRQGNCVGMSCIFGNGCTKADHFVLWWKNPGTDYQKGQIGQIRCPPSPVGTPN